MQTHRFISTGVMSGSVAEWSKALVLGTSLSGRGFESHRCQNIFAKIRICKAFFLDMTGWPAVAGSYCKQADECELSALPCPIYQHYYSSHCSNYSQPSRCEGDIPLCYTSFSRKITHHTVWHIRIYSAYHKEQYMKAKCLFCFLRESKPLRFLNWGDLAGSIPHSRKLDGVGFL